MIIEDYARNPFPFEIGDHLIDEYGDECVLQYVDCHYCSLLWLTGVMTEDGDGGDVQDTDYVHDSFNKKKSDDRNTRFQGFAKLLWQEVRKTSFDSPGFSKYQQLEQRMQLLFAQRAYDLMEHIMLYAPAARVPDMTEWPEEE